MYLKIFSIFFLSTFLISSVCKADNPSSDLQKAHVLFDKGEQEKAKKIYSKLAEQGDPEGHFALVYRYSLTLSQQNFHLKEAAKEGHQEALYYILENLVFRANDLFEADPIEALELYKKAKQKNVRINPKQMGINTINQCIEMGAGDFDAESFLEKNGLKEKYQNHQKNNGNPYYIWSLAEKAQKGELGDNPNRLTAQLVCRGAFVPAELEAAVNHIYSQYKKSEQMTFDICDHITSGYGGAFCSNRDLEKQDKLRKSKLTDLSKKLAATKKKKLFETYELAGKFYVVKADLEEYHAGSGRGGFAIASINDHKKKFIEDLNKVISGDVDPTALDLKNLDKELNKKYKQVQNFLKREPITDINLRITDQDVKEVQRHWIKYRDSKAELYSSLSKDPNKTKWKAYITKERIQQLDNIIHHKNF